jgi:hypothetical protein
MRYRIGVGGNCRHRRWVSVTKVFRVAEEAELAGAVLPIFEGTNA